MRKITNKPFTISKKGSKAALHNSAGKDEDIDDVMSEISTPEIDFSERKKIMDALAKREKFREELELEDCLKSLTGKAMDLGVDKDEIESVASQTFSELKMQQ